MEPTPPEDDKKRSGAKAKDQGTGDKKAKSTQPKAVLHLNVATAMTNSLPHMPRFDKRFEVMEDDHDNCHFIAVSKDKVCKHVSQRVVERAITAYYFNKMETGGRPQMVPSDAAASATLYMALTYPTPESDIQIVAQKSTDILCWHRLSWDLSEGDTPVFDEIMSRASNAKALMAWIGSLLVTEADREQYVWIYGSGQNSKGSLARFLRRVLGPSFASETVPKGDSKFWTSGILGKRLVNFPDCNNYTFPLTGLFKSLTGGDAQRIERKGEQPFTASINAKFLFLSNEKPEVSGSVADRRRAIYVEMSPVADGKVLAASQIDNKLWAEGPAFLHKCYRLYHAVCKNHGKIPTDTKALDTLIEANESNYHGFVEEHLVINETGYTVRYIMQKLMIKEGYRSGMQQRKLLQFLEREYRVKKDRITDDKTKERLRVYLGASLTESTRQIMT